MNCKLTKYIYYQWNRDGLERNVYISRRCYVQYMKMIDAIFNVCEHLINKYLEYIFYKYKYINIILDTKIY